MLSLDLTVLVLYAVRGHFLRLGMDEFKLDPMAAPDFTKVFETQKTLLGVVGCSFFFHAFYLMHVLATVSIVRGLYVGHRSKMFH